MRLFSQSCQCIHSCRCDITPVQNSVNKFPWLSDFFSHPSLTPIYVLTKWIRWTMWWHSIWYLISGRFWSHIQPCPWEQVSWKWMKNACNEEIFRQSEAVPLDLDLQLRPRARFGRNRRRWNLRIGALLVQCWTSTSSAEMSFTGHCKSLNDHLRI